MRILPGERQTFDGMMKKESRRRKVMREEEKIKAGILFCPGDPELRAIKRKTHNLNVDYNSTHEDETEKRAAILKEIIGE